MARHFVKTVFIAQVLLVISSLGCEKLIGYYCVAHRPSVHLKQNSGAGDTAKATGLIYFRLLFMARSFWVDNAHLFHFFIPSVMSAETDENQTAAYCIAYHGHLQILLLGRSLRRSHTAMFINKLYVWGKMYKQMHGQWCIQLALFFIFCFPLIGIIQATV